MSNCISNCLYIRGSVAVVDEICTEVLAFGPAFVLPPTAEDIDSEPINGTKTACCWFESPSDAPWNWFKATVAKYHAHGVRFYLSWTDSDNLHQNDIAPDGELLYTRFGEYYTDLISASDFGPQQGYRCSVGPINLVFNQRNADGDPVSEVMTESGSVITINSEGDVISIVAPTFMTEAPFEPGSTSGGLLSPTNF